MFNLDIQNYNLKKFMILIFSLQFAFISIILLNNNLINPIFQELIISSYLLFIPGIITLRLLKLKEMNNTEHLVYSVGLSISILMIIGLMINSLHQLGIYNPLNSQNILIGISTFSIISCFIIYFKEKNEKIIIQKNTFDIPLAPFILIIFTLIISIFGIALSNNYNQNIGLLVSIILISLNIFLIGINKFIPEKLYPFALFIITFSLLLQTWFLSSYLVGRDVFSEYYTSLIVIQNSYWQSVIPPNEILLSTDSNAMLILTIFIPLFSKISQINLLMIYKLIIPFISSFAALGLYQIFKKYTSNRIAFLSSVIFVIMGFYNVFLVSAKQLIAMFFIILVILCIDSKEFDYKKAFLAIIFSFSIVVSHYGTSYIFMFFLLFSIIAFYILKRVKGEFLDNKLRISMTFVLLFSITALSWYIYVSDASVFNTIIKIFDQISGSVANEIFASGSAQGLNMALKSPETITGHIHKFLILFMQFCIVVGFFAVLKRKKKFNFSSDFLVLSLCALVINMLAVVLPNFSSAIYTPRLYIINLIFLAPFIAIGFSYIFEKIKIINYFDSKKLFSIFVILLLLFQVGFVKEITQETSSSIPLGKEKLFNSSALNVKSNFYLDYNIFPQNKFALSWLNNLNNTSVYSDKTSLSSIYSYNIKLAEKWKFLTLKTEMQKNNYAYLSYSNIRGGVFLNIINLNKNIRNVEKSDKIRSKLSNESLIYSNGGSEIYIA